jgi:hypothetical protein
MSLTLGAVMALSQQCAPGIALEAIVPQIHVESHFNELAIGVNNGPKVHARSLAEAVTLATRYIQAGFSVDLGLAQINSKNLPRLGLTVEQAFDACTSLRAAETVLTESYNSISNGRNQTDPESTALRRAAIMASASDAGEDGRNLGSRIREGMTLVVRRARWSRRGTVTAISQLRSRARGGKSQDRPSIVTTS